MLEKIINFIKSAKVTSIAVDGDGGKATVTALQKLLKSAGYYKDSVDGYIGGQNASHKQYRPALTAVKNGKGGSATVRAMQTWMKMSNKDGLWGKDVSTALQKVLVAKGYLAKGGIDGIFGKASMKALQQMINNNGKPKPSPSPTDPLQKWYDAMKTQFNWSKNQKYEFLENPTVANSKTKGTCITFVAVALQRIGLLPSGKYFYLYPKTMRIAGNGADYVKKHTEIFALSYPNKTIAQLGNNIKKGDIIGFGDPAYHTMVYMGKNGSGQPIFNTMGHFKGLSVPYQYYANRKVNMLVRIKKIK